MNFRGYSFEAEYLKLPFMKIFLFLLFSLLIMPAIYAQKSGSLLRGQLTDSINRSIIDNATISLITAVDSSLLSFTRSDSNGRFSFKNITPGKYRLSATHTAYHTTWKNFEITGDREKDLGFVLMTDKTVLKEILINAEKPPVVMNGDTLEFNAASFRTKPNVHSIPLNESPKIFALLHL